MKICKINIIFIVLLIILTNGACDKNKNRPNEACRNVILAQPEVIGERTTHTYNGVIKENKSLNAAFMTGGKLSSLKVKEGDRIKKGQLLATLDDTDYKIGVTQLQVQYEQMTVEKQRMDELFKRHEIAPNDYEKFEAGYKQLALQLEMAKNQLDYTQLYSPEDGFISYKYMEVGELVDAGTPIYKITNDSYFTVETDLPASIYLNKDNIKNFYGILPALEEKIPLKVESFIPDADNNQLYHIKLSVPVSKSKDITSGMNMKVSLEIENGMNGEMLVPSRSIFEEKGNQFVWVFNDKDSTISKNKVITIGEPQRDKNRIKGLSEDKKIVAVGVKQLTDGEKVKVVENPVKEN